MLTNDPLTKDNYELPPGFEPKNPWIQARDASHHTMGKLHKNYFTEVWENYIDISLRPQAETGLTREARRLYPSYIHIANYILLL